MSPSDLTVYIVDDDQSVRDALSLMLSVRSYRTALFSDAASFLEGYRPDWRGCVLLDLRMPEMDGLELQQRLTEIGCDIPVIGVVKLPCLGSSFGKTVKLHIPYPPHLMSELARCLRVALRKPQRRPVWATLLNCASNGGSTISPWFKVNRSERG